jgi:hypothetical protein
MAPENADDSDADCGLDTTAAERQMAESLAGRRASALKRRIGEIGPSMLMSRRNEGDTFK